VITGDARVEPNGKTWTLIFVRELRQPPERVWTALTDPDELDRWAPFRPDRDLGQPGDAVLVMVDGDERQPMPGVVMRAEAPALLEYSWGADLLRWELEASGAGTRLTLRHTLSEAPDMRAMVAAGWHLCTGVLQQVLDGADVPVIRGQAAMDHGMQELVDAYGKKFGI
jgi:uncharacterized protein YndB with AHSA1/START domain